MRYWRLFPVFLLLSLVPAGCRHKPEPAAPPPHAQAPIVSTMPPVPPLTFPDVELAKPKPQQPKPVVTPAPVEPPQKKHIAHVRRHRAIRKAESSETTDTGASDTAGAPTPAAAEPSHADAPAPAPATTTGASVLGQLSADDATANPHQNIQTQQLIQATESRLKQIPEAQQAAHKDAVAQVASFLTQAKQAWAMNDVVGAQTLANKAKILLDELLTALAPPQ